MRAPRALARARPARARATVAPSRADEAVARRVERPRRRLAGPRRAAAVPRPFIVVKPASSSGWMQASPPPARTDVGVAAAEQLGGLADRVRAGRAGREGRVVRAAQVEHRRRSRRSRCRRRRCGEEVRRDPLPAALAHDVVLLDHRVEAADRRAEEHADARRVVDRRGRRRRPPRCAAASASRTLRSMRRASLAPATATGSKPLTSPATADRQVARVELRGLGDAGAAGEQRLPGLVGRRARRARRCRFP